MNYVRHLFSGRLNRRNYLVGMVCFISALIVGVLALNNSGYQDYFILPMALVSLFYQFSISVRRSHDINHSGWYALLSVTPYVGVIFSLILLTKSGVSTENKYGHVPQDLIDLKKILGIY